MKVVSSTCAKTLKSYYTYGSSGASGDASRKGSSLGGSGFTKHSTTTTEVELTGSFTRLCDQTPSEPNEKVGVAVAEGEDLA